MEVAEGSILDANEKYIAVLAAACGRQAGGLLHYMFRRFPYSNIYNERSSYHKPEGSSAPGNITVHGDGKQRRYVINMIAQHYPGHSISPMSIIDGHEVRQRSFYKCLQEICKLPDIQSIAFPYKIGCGLAGGNWDTYLNMLQEFDRAMKENNVSVVLYRHMNHD